MSIEKDDSDNATTSESKPDVLLLQVQSPSVDNPQLINMGRNDIPNHHGDKTIRAPSTHWKLLRNNRSYRLFATSYALTETGEWFSYVASIALLQRGLDAKNPDNENLDESNNLSEIGLLLMIWVIPSFLFFPFGGVVADSFDRRKAMTRINILGFFVTLGYLIPYFDVSSIWLLYVATFVRQALAAIYEPCSQAILPMIVTDPEELKKANIQITMIHSIASTLGSAMGGFFVTIFGLLVCLLLDSSAYLGSALVTSFIRGSWTPAAPLNSIDGNGNEIPLYNTSDQDRRYSYRTLRNSIKFIWKYFSFMFVGGLKYLRQSFFGALVFLKFTSTMLYGPVDTLMVAYSDLYRKEEGILSRSSTIFGILLACNGFGAILGGAAVEWFANVDNPKKLQRDCIYPFLIMGAAYVLMGLVRSLVVSCFCTALIYCSITITWIESDLILQLFSSEEMLGRVTSVDFALAMAADGVAAYICGIVQDDLGVPAHYVSMGLGVGCFSAFIAWSIFHYMGKGAGKYSYEALNDSNQPTDEEVIDVEWNPSEIIDDEVILVRRRMSELERVKVFHESTERINYNEGEDIILVLGDGLNDNVNDYVEVIPYYSDVMASNLDAVDDIIIVLRRKMSEVDCRVDDYNP